MPTKVQLKADELQAKRTKIHEIFALGIDNLNADQVEEVKSLNLEADSLGKELGDLRELETIEKKNVAGLEDGKKVERKFAFGGGSSDLPNKDTPEFKSLGEWFVECAAYKQYERTTRQSPAVSLDQVELKTLMTDATGFTPQAIRTGQVIDSAQQQPKIVDVIPSVTTDQIAVVFMRETTYTNGAIETAEGALYNEAALAYTEASMPIRKLAVFLPVTDEQLADVNAMRERINNRLTLMMRQRLDSQLVNGDGTGQNLTGLLATTGLQTQAHVAGEPTVDTIYKGLTDLRTIGFVEPNATIMNPLDWQNIRLLRTADGLYIFGNPSDPGVERLWGLPIVQSTYVPQGKAVAGDFAGYSELNWKAGLEFEISNSHADFFQRGQLAIRAQMRCAFVVLRPNAFVQCTGL